MAQAQPKILEPINYSPEPTIEDFHMSDAIVKGILGPEGSGKSVGCFFDLFKYACRQEPYKGKRSTHWTVVRNNYPSLITTSVRTFDQWFSGLCSKSPSKQPPIEATVRLGLPDKTEVEMMMLFLALDVPDDVKKLKSLETTGGFLNEASEMGRWILTRLLGRCGRWPPKRWGVPPVWSGVIMDTNACEDDHWWYKAAEEKTPEGWQFFKQPSALIRFQTDKRAPAIERAKQYVADHQNLPEDYLRIVEDMFGNAYVGNPEAENAKWQPLGINYWLNTISGRPLKEITTLVMGEYGPTGDDVPVYPEYQDNIHCAMEILKPMPGIGITLGFDFGLMPACTFSQISPRGQKIFFDEMQVEKHGAMGIRQLSREYIVPYLLDNFLQWLTKGLIKGFGDPAGSQRAQTDEKTCYQILRECPVTSPTGTEGSVDFKANGKRLADPEYFKKIREQAAKGYASLGDIGVEVRPAHTNKFGTRRDAMSKLMLLKIDGDPAFVISRKCKILRKGLRGKYRYKRMQVGGSDERYVDEPIKDATSHTCFVAGTIISIPTGTKSIELLNVGDLVNTPYGPKTVTFTGTREADVIRLTFDSAPETTCTKDHPFWNFTCFSPAEALVYAKLTAKEDWLWKFLFRLHRLVVGKDLQYGPSLSSRVKDIIESRHMDITSRTKKRQGVNTFTWKFGLQTMALFQKATRFITETRIKPIMTLQTYPQGSYQSTTATTCSNRKGLRFPKEIYTRQSEGPPSGEDRTLKKQARSEGLGRQRSRKRSTPTWLNATALCVESLISFLNISKSKLVFALRHAFQKVEGRPVWMILTGHALYAATAFVLTSMRKQKLARVVASENLSQTADVYNIEVADAHCYYANGLLVSNCEAAMYDCLMSSYFAHDSTEESERAKQAKLDALDTPSKAASKEYAGIMAEIKYNQEAMDVWF